MRILVLMAALALAAAPARAAHTVNSGDLEVHLDVVPTNELTLEAAKDYNVERSSTRGLLTVTVLKKANGGKARSMPAQIYAGALNQNNYLMNIPIREMQKSNEVYYLGEFRLAPPETFRFLVNVNVLGKPLKAEFSRLFPQQP